MAVLAVRSEVNVTEVSIRDLVGQARDALLANGRPVAPLDETVIYVREEWHRSSEGLAYRLAERGLRRMCEQILADPSGTHRDHKAQCNGCPRGRANCPCRDGRCRLGMVETAEGPRRCETCHASVDS